MAKTKIQFQYSEIRSFEEPLTIAMEVPERSIEEMCEYFQRFLSACGYIFEEGEYIGTVRKETKKPSYPTTPDEILSFGCYSPPDQQLPCSGVRGDMSDDLINLG